MADVVSANTKPPASGSERGVMSVDEIIDVLSERIAHLEIVRGGGPIAKRPRELDALRAAVALLRAPPHTATPG
jgi:hypothetical protein